MEELNKKNSEIDVLGLVKNLLLEWKTISLFVLVFAILGVLAGRFSTKEYKADVVLAPETSGGANLSGIMGGLESYMGLSFGKGSVDAIYPDLYPNIISSTTFLLDLFDIPVVLKDSTTEIYYDHLEKNWKPSVLSYPNILLSKIISLFKEKKDIEKDAELNPFYLTPEQYKVCNIMRKQVQCVVDQRTSLITVSVTDVDALVAAAIADTVTSRLQKYITNYRTKKVRNDLEYVAKMYEQAQKEYLDIQKEYAKHADANMNVVKESQRIQLENLKNEMLLKSSLYSAMAQQLQVARQRLQERTPAFMTIQPAIVPLETTGITPMVRLMMFGFFGAVLGSVWCLYLKGIYKSFVDSKKK